MWRLSLTGHNLFIIHQQPPHPITMLMTASRAYLVCPLHAASQCCVLPPVLDHLPSAAASAPAVQSRSRCSRERHTTDLETERLLLSLHTKLQQ